MPIIEINSCNYGSTGNIMLQIAEAARNKKFNVVTCCPASRSNKQKQADNQLFIGNRFSRNIHLKLNQLTGFNGCFSFFSTLAFFKKIDTLHPNLIHLHNLHNCYVNLPLLFNYVKKHNIPVVWTLHDCWSFTGQCPYFTLAKCGKWKNGCYDCPSYREYPSTIVDRSRTMWKLKKKWFTGVENMTIVTPSQWLADLVKQSYLKDYPVKVINNGIDLDVFKPTPSNFRKEHEIRDDQVMLLGVSFAWGKRKGLDVWIELAKRLDDKYVIVLVGTTDEIDIELPENVISIHKTNNQAELAEIYTAADIFVNPTREENYPTVNMEAIACGTPVITFNTGGSPEIIDENTGIAVPCDDIDELERCIEYTVTSNRLTTENCLEHAQSFDYNERFNEYINLYVQIPVKQHANSIGTACCSGSNGTEPQCKF